MIRITQLLAFFGKNLWVVDTNQIIICLCIAVSIFRMMILIPRILFFISIYYYLYISFFISISHNYNYSLSLLLKDFHFESLRYVNTHDNIYYWLLISLFKKLFENKSEISLCVIILWKYSLRILGEKDYQWIKKKGYTFNSSKTKPWKLFWLLRKIFVSQGMLIQKLFKVFNVNHLFLLKFYLKLLQKESF